MRSNRLILERNGLLRQLGAFAVLTVSVGLFANSPLHAKKPGGGGGTPHHVILVDDRLVNEGPPYNSPTLESWGDSTFTAALAGGSLDAGDFCPIVFRDDYDEIILTLRNCMWTVHKRGGAVEGVTFFFTTGGSGIHRTDQLPATSIGSTIHIRLDDEPVWKEKGSGKGTVAGWISVGDIVYEPVD